MTYTSLSKSASRVITGSRLIALAMIVTFAAVAVQPARAQTSDTWKSVAIIGGSTAAGAYIGHKIAGPTGTWIGAGVGASAGYAIDRRRRQNESYNQAGYGYPGPYDPNAGYYPNDGGNYGGPYSGAPYPGGLQYQNTKYSGSTYQRNFSQRRR